MLLTCLKGLQATSNLVIKQLLGIKLEVASWEKSTKLYKVSQKDVGRWDTMLENVR